MKRLRAPFPWPGSKYAAAPLIEDLMGPIMNLAIPFAGSLGELLGRSSRVKVVTVNDLDGLVVNAWRAMKYSPAELAFRCDHPVHEATLHAAHDLLLNSAFSLRDLMESDPEAHDVRLAAWWIWGASCWLGSGWCREPTSTAPRRRPMLEGQGERPHYGVGVVAKRQLPLLRGSDGTGVGYGVGVHAGHRRGVLPEYFAELADALHHVRIVCGDWARVLTPAVTTSHGLTGVFLDPPYRHDLRCTTLYREDNPELSGLVRAWCLINGGDPLLRIVIAGKGDEHDELLEHGWTRYVWRERDGETLWASPHCRVPAPAPVDPQGDLFAAVA